MDKGKSIIIEVEGDDERKIDLPPGYRFVPTDTELVVHYLFNKVSHKPLPGNMIIAINIYDFHPQQLALKYPSLGKIHWYSFTPRERNTRMAFDRIEQSQPGTNTGRGRHPIKLLCIKIIL
ncbi:NAC transcription factor [Actinidia chinensis var. chinensis]|uniref:NAC transcription factor n=1 Tax=Actinidia chinensis var. chinensis TaxID=1590841 RepID=A0A2R6PHF5_ACTCC|nr:NAC transcription factor [Actinidia chinensis var. chinensis]